VLIECDPSIKSIIMNLNSDHNEYLIQDLDESHLVIQEDKVQQLKSKLDEVSLPVAVSSAAIEHAHAISAPQRDDPRARERFRLGSRCQGGQEEMSICGRCRHGRLVYRGLREAWRLERT
jgi:hypothetical protein